MLAFYHSIIQMQTCQPDLVRTGIYCKDQRMMIIIGYKVMTQVQLSIFFGISFQVIVQYPVVCSSQSVSLFPVFNGASS